MTLAVILVSSFILALLFYRLVPVKKKIVISGIFRETRVSSDYSCKMFIFQEYCLQCASTSPAVAESIEFDCSFSIQSSCKVIGRLPYRGEVVHMRERRKVIFGGKPSYDFIPVDNELDLAIIEKAATPQFRRERLVWQLRQIEKKYK